MKVISRKNALLLAALLIALAAACAFALSRAQTAVMLEETAFAPDGERDAMTVSLKATEDLRTIKGEIRLTATNRTGGDRDSAGERDAFGCKGERRARVHRRGQRRSLRLAD